jgi:hypothetical protein
MSTTAQSDLEKIEDNTPLGLAGHTSKAALSSLRTFGQSSEFADISQRPTARVLDEAAQSLLR